MDNFKNRTQQNFVRPIHHNFFKKMLVHASTNKYEYKDDSGSSGGVNIFIGTLQVSGCLEFTKVREHRRASFYVQ